MNITSACVIFQVGDLAKSIAFYCDVLGFTREFAYGEPPFYGGVKKNDVIFHLCSSKENALRRGMGSAYVFCDEVDAYYEQVKLDGAAITSPLATQPYGIRDFQLKDPDGNLIGFGCPVPAGK